MRGSVLAGAQLTGLFGLWHRLLAGARFSGGAAWPCLGAVLTEGRGLADWGGVAGVSDPERRSCLARHD
jgi:hypothetical protein